MVFQDSYIKTGAFETLKKRFSLEDHEIAYIGDDYIDTPILKRCGAAFAPANAIEEVKSLVDYATLTPGGSGAFREMVDMILRVQGSFDQAIDKLHGLY